MDKASCKWINDTQASIHLHSSKSRKKTADFEVFGKYNPDGTLRRGMRVTED